jgi:hypothetical protein
MIKQYQNIVFIFSILLSLSQPMMLINSTGVSEQANLQSCKPTPQNLVSWWRAEGNTSDYYGDNNGSPQNGVVYIDGQVGTSFLFDGIDDYIHIPTSSSLSPQNSFTIEAWIYPTWSEQDISHKNIMSKWGGESNWSRVYSFLAYGRKILFAISDPAHENDGEFHTFQTSEDVLTLNAWNYVSAVYEQSSGTRRIYVNGVLAATRIDTPITVSNSMADVTIGAMRSPSIGEFFNGQIDEVSFYNRALTSNEIMEIYQAGSSGKCFTTCINQPAGTVSWWRAEGDSRDHYGLNPGALINGASFNLGMVGQAFQFDGMNDYVLIPDSPTIDTSGSFTLEGWIYPTWNEDDSTWHNIMSKWGEGSEWLRSFSFLASGTKIRFAISDVAHENDSVFHSFDTSENALSLNKWNYVAATYDKPSGTRRIFVNGVEMANRVDMPITVSSSGGDAAIGALHLPNVDTEFFKGQIDEFSYYNRALTSEEISEIYGTTSAGKCDTKTYSIKGYIQDTNGDPINGVIITDRSGHLTATQTDGSFNLTDLKPGDYSIFPTKPGFSFAPLSASISIPPDADGIQFTGTNICPTLPNSLVSWWRSEENADDVLGQNNGTQVNGMTYGSGKIGHSFMFNGTTDYIHIPSSATLNPSGSFTLETWIFPTWQEEDTSHRNIISKWGGEGGWSRAYSFLAYGRKLLFAISDPIHEYDNNFHTFTTPNDVLTLNSWNHVAAVYNQATGSRYIYVNGLEVASRTDAPIQVSDSLADVTIGGMRSPYFTAEFFQGMIDELAYYNDALSPSVLQTIYNGGSSGKCNIENYSISGKVVLPNNEPVAGVMISDEIGHFTTTDIDGQYVLAELQVGSYTIHASKSGYSFNPSSQSVIVPPHAVEKNFTVFSISPVVHDINPIAKPAGGDNFELIVTGENFLEGSSILWNNTVLLTTYVSRTQLRAQVTTNLISETGQADVRIVSSTQEISGSKMFTITSSLIKPWTFLLYFDGDNNLFPYLQRAVQNLENQPDNPDVNIVVLWDGPENGDSKKFLIQHGGMYTNEVNQWWIGEADMGDPQTLANFVLWAKTQYPANYYYLSIADHGRGTSGIAWDSTNNNDFLTTSEISTALSIATNNGLEKLDVIHFDACLMGMFEVAYQVKDYATYMIASENLGWSVFSYDQYANLRVNPQINPITPNDLTIKIVNEYANRVSDYAYTISAFDLRDIGYIESSLENLTNALINNMIISKTNIQEARVLAQKFDSRDYMTINDEDEYVDLYNYAYHLNQLSSISDVKITAQELMNSISSGFIVAERHESDLVNGINLDNSKGVSIFFPPRSGSWDYSYYIAHQLFNFTKNSKWDDFLCDYFGFAGLQPDPNKGGILPPYVLPQKHIFLPNIRK